MMISPSIRPLEQETKPHNHKSQYLGTIKVFLRTGFFRAYFLIFAINLRTLSLQTNHAASLMTLAYILFTTITVVCLLSNQLLIESILSILAAMICKKSRGNTETVLCHLHRLTISTMILHKSSANPWTHAARLVVPNSRTDDDDVDGDYDIRYKALFKASAWLWCCSLYVVPAPPVSPYRVCVLFIN